MNDSVKNLAKALKGYLVCTKKQPNGIIYGAAQRTPRQPAKNTRVIDELQCLYNQNKSCTACPLALQGRTQVVFGTGNPRATLMFIGEGPGKDEDAQGLPFVGRAGQLLTKIIEAMGFSRDQVYISNVVKCRPPNNRTPLPNESSTCKERILLKEIELIKPKYICTLGSIATQALLGADIKISQARGQFFPFDSALLMPTYHPAYLLRNPAEKRTVWEDMKKLKKHLEENCG